jgi:hypothetical protein
VGEAAALRRQDPVVGSLVGYFGTLIRKVGPYSILSRGDALLAKLSRLSPPALVRIDVEGREPWYWTASARVRGKSDSGLQFFRAIDGELQESRFAECISTLEISLVHFYWDLTA